MLTLPFHITFLQRATWHCDTSPLPALTFPSPPTPLSPSQYVENSRGKRLFRRVWKADTERPRGVILLVHGFNWHSGYFSRLASRLNDLNFLDVVTYDLQVGNILHLVDLMMIRI